MVTITDDLLETNSIFEGSLEQRQFQDVHVMTQLGQGRMSHYDDVAKFYLGIEAEGLF